MNLRSLVSLALLLAVRPVQASEPVPSLASGIGQMVLGLGVVLVLLIASLWLIKRLSAPRGAATGMQVLGGVSLGSRERVVLVEVGDTVLVLGVSPASVTTLHTMESSALRRATPAPAGERSSDFARWLKTSLDKRRGAD